MKEITIRNDGDGFYRSDEPYVFICIEGMRKYIRLGRRPPAELVAVFTKTGGPDSFRIDSSGEIVGVTDGWRQQEEGSGEYMTYCTRLTLEEIYNEGYRHVRVEIAR
jgi:hypothetical protein